MRNLPQKTQTLVIQIQRIPSPDFNFQRATLACIIIAQDHSGGISTFSRLVVPLACLLISSRPHLGDFVQLRSRPWKQACAVAKEEDSENDVMESPEIKRAKMEFLKNLYARKKQPTEEFPLSSTLIGRTTQLRILPSALSSSGKISIRD